jgi:hypothetical protein
MGIAKRSNISTLFTANIELFLIQGWRSHRRSITNTLAVMPVFTPLFLEPFDCVSVYIRTPKCLKSSLSRIFPSLQLLQIIRYLILYGGQSFYSYEEYIKLGCLYLYKAVSKSSLKPIFCRNFLSLHLFR